MSWRAVFAFRRVKFPKCSNKTHPTGNKTLGCGRMSVHDPKNTLLALHFLYGIFFHYHVSPSYPLPPPSPPPLASPCTHCSTASESVKRGRCIVPFCFVSASSLGVSTKMNPELSKQWIYIIIFQTQGCYHGYHATCFKGKYDSVK